MIKILQNKDLFSVNNSSVVIASSNEILKYKNRYLKENTLVTTFDNLVRKILNKYSNKKIVTKEESYIFMYLAFNNVREKLRIYNNLSNYELFHLLINTYDFYKEHKVISNDKTHDLILIYEDYDRLLSENNLISMYDSYIEVKKYIKYIKEDNIYFANLKELKNNWIYLIKELDKYKNVFIYVNTLNNNSLVKKINELYDVKYEISNNIDVNNLYKIGSNNLFNNIPIISCNDLYEEVMYIYQDINKKIDEGFNYNDILIVSSDIKRYEYYFDLIFNIPYSKNIKKGILVKKFIHIFSNIINGNFTCFNFISLLKLRLFDYDEKLINDLDNYIYMWNLEDTLFYDEFKFNPSGKRNFLDSDYEKLENLNDLRLKVLNQIKYLLENTVNENTTSEILRYFFMYLEEEKVIDKLFEYDTDGYNKFIDILELVNDHIKLGDLSNVLNIIDNLYKPFNDFIKMKDEVMITSLDDYYNDDKKIIYFIGVTEKDIPSSFSFNTLINEDDLLPDDSFNLISTYNDIQKNNISNVLLNDNVIITYHRLTDEPSKVGISPLLSKFSGKRDNFVYRLNKPYNNNLNLNISSSLAKKLYGENISVSPSSLEMFSKCKYSYFLNYGLRLKIKEKLTFDNREVGTFIHFILEKIIENNFEKINTLDIRCLVNEYSDLYFSLNVRNINNTLKYVIEQLKESTIILIETILMELKGSLFKPEKTEFMIKQLDYKIKLDDGTLSISGIVDRIDSYEDNNNYYFRIIDYKTGSKKFRLDDILIGLNMQMPLYLLAIKNNKKTNKNIIPTGFLYYPALLHYKKENIGTNVECIMNNLKDSLKMNGILNKDYLFLYDEEKIGDFIDIKSRNNINDEKVLNSDEMGLLLKKVESVLKEEGDSILNGDISINPIKDYKNDSCKYCKFDSVCAFNPKNDKVRKYKSLKKRDVLLSIEGDVNGMDN